jgi:aquaporin Z
MKLSSRLGAEFLGTFLLVFGGTGAAVLAAKYVDPNTSEATGLGIGFVGVSLAFGLTVVAGAYALGPISGGHFNPAISIGLAAAKKFAWKDVLPYVVVQVVAAICASGLLWLIAINKEGTTKETLTSSGFAANGFGDHSPGHFALIACLLIEVVLTAVFLLVIAGVTDKKASPGFAALAIGLTLTLIHLISIPVTNTSVNPARSTGPALALAFGGDSWALGQLWLFWVAPIVGGVIGALVYALVGSNESDESLEEAMGEGAPRPA